MKQRLLTALVVGVISAGVGYGVAVGVMQNMKEHATSIAGGCGLLGFLLGLVFKLRPV